MKKIKIKGKIVAIESNFVAVENEESILVLAKDDGTTIIFPKEKLSVFRKALEMVNNQNRN